MKVKCVRWDGDGTPTWPLWDGSAWSWRDADGNQVEPPKSRILIKDDDYLAIGCWYNDDGTNPDPRAKKGAFVQHPVRIPRYTRVGRERPLKEVQADIDHWLKAMPAEIDRRIANIKRKPSDSSRFKAVSALRPKAED